MDRNTKKEKILNYIIEKEKEFVSFCGGGWQKRIKRLLIYRTKYLKHIFWKFKPIKVKTRVFLNRNFYCLLPDIGGIYLLGMIPHWGEFRLAKFLIRNLKSNSVFYDVGAQYGFYTLLAGELIDKGQIHAFEPGPEAFEILKLNVGFFDNVFLNEKAVFSENKEIEFYNATEAGVEARSSTNLATFDSSIRLKKIKVQAITLDEYSQNHQKPDFIKIDVEGGEGEVIKGAKKLLEENSPVIAMEVWRKPMNNRSHLEAMEILDALGYRAYKITQDGDLEYIGKVNPEREIQEDNNSDNFIWKKN